MRRPARTDYVYNEYVKDFYRKIEDYDWNEVTDNWRGLESLLHRYRERRIKQLIGRFGRGDKYLDVGCGTGLMLRHLPAGSVGIDINPRHLKRAKKYVPESELRQGDAEQLEFPDDFFSTVICTEVLEHLVDSDKAVGEIKRVLRPEGVFIGSVPARSLLWRFRFLSSTHYHNEPFHNEYVKKEIRQLLSPFKLVLLKTGFLSSSFFFVGRKGG
ncbi:MAG: class I SAM-dependent methyltransferase [bacterium]